VATPTDDPGKPRLGPDTPIRTEPAWPLLTTYSVNLLEVPTHQHGPNGPHYVTYQDAVQMLHWCIKAINEAQEGQT
jgi:hypothetical protein